MSRILSQRARAVAAGGIVAASYFVAGPAGTPAARAQTAPPEATATKPSDAQLPPVIVETPKEAPPAAEPPAAAAPQPVQRPADATPAAKPPKKVAKSPAAPSAPSAPPAAPASDATAESAPSGQGQGETKNPLANPGTPSAGVVPVFGIAGSPGAQTATGIDTGALSNDPLFSVDDLLKQSPGVSLKQGNGPRDMGVSIRGSNARNGFAVRNIVMMEDGFPVTQPDGLSRTDLTDPHAYGGVDVWRGPSSAMFGNYATGGAINFRLRKGGDINGIEAGSDFGSFNYFNNYVIGGAKSGAYEATVFASDVRGDGIFQYSAFDTQTINALLTYQPTTSDTFTVKVINNLLETELPFRLSLNQFEQNPFQNGCQAAGGSVANANRTGCAALNYSATGNNNSGAPGARKAQTAEEAGANRDDRRTIAGARWEHKFDADTMGRLQVVLDDRNISQPTGTTSAEGDFFSYNVVSDISARSKFNGLPTNHYLGFFWNYLPIDSNSYHVAPGPGTPLGLLQSNTDGYTMNFGARARQETQLTDSLTLVGGIGIEKTLLEGIQTSWRYSVAGVPTATSPQIVEADREFLNVAPEIGVLFRPNAMWQLRGRVAKGYGTPQIGNLFVTSDGEPGNNTELEPQTNIGYDAGVDFTPASGVSLSVTGFYEFFTNELVSQGTVPGRSNTSFNAPASEHRGVEVSANIELLDGWRLTTAYLYNDQFYTDYTERLVRSAGGGNPARVAELDRAGNKIPGVAPHELIARLGYDVPTGLFKGLGAYAEYEWTDSFYMDNGNILKAPGAESINLNVHYRADINGDFVKSVDLFFEVKNVKDEINVAGANNIANTLDAAGNENPESVLRMTSGSIYAAPPRTFYGGVKVKF